MAVKKKVAKKATKKAPAKKAAAKKPAAKKAVAKKKAAAKKPAAKRTVKKAAAKKPAKKAVAKKRVAKKAVAKKVAKKSTAKKAAPKKRTAKKAVAKRSSASTVRVPAVPVTSSAARAAAPVAPVRPAPAAPAAKPQQGASNRVVMAVIVGIALLALVVWSQSSEKDDDAAPMPTMSADATPTTDSSATPTESATSDAAVETIEAPGKFVALSTSAGVKLRWFAPAATEGLTGYLVEIAPEAKEWQSVATVPVDQTTLEMTKSEGGWTQFRVSSVYSDGQVAPAKIFGLPGQYK